MRLLFFALLFASTFVLTLGTEAQAQVTLNPGESVTVQAKNVQEESHDSDGDGVFYVEGPMDNCPNAPNPAQNDLDGDGDGDACDPQDNRDSDGDSVQNFQDKCEGSDDAIDPDADGIPSGCDSDRDGDGRDNASDYAPDNPNIQDPPDTTPPPVPSITAGQAEGSTRTSTDDVTFSFQTTEQGAAFECRLRKDGSNPSFTACVSPQTYNDNGNGSFSFEVRAVDAAGNISAAKVRNFTINVPPPPVACQGQQVQPGNGLATTINADPSGTATTFCLASGDYPINSIINLRSGDSIQGPEGQIINAGPASYGVPTAKIHADNVTLSRIIQMFPGTGPVKWVEVSGADTDYTATTEANCTTRFVAGRGCLVNGSGTGVAMSQAGAQARLQYAYVHNNDMQGAGASGYILNSHFTDNSQDPNTLGFGAGSMKGITEFVFAYNFVHNEQANGPWYDHSLKGAGNVPEMASNPGGGAWFHHNLIVNNGRWGMRYEYVPRDVATGEHPTAPSFLAEDNVMAGNGTEPGHVGGGASQEDAMNGTFRNNTFGPVTINGTSYGHNEGNLALRFSDGAARTTDLFRSFATGNTLQGETIGGCQLPDTEVDCQNNTP